MIVITKAMESKSTKQLQRGVRTGFSLDQAQQWISTMMSLLSYTIFTFLFYHQYDFPGRSDGKASAYHAGDPGLILGLGGSSGEGNGNPLQYSCLENPMDGGVWWATVHRVAKSWT